MTTAWYDTVYLPIVKVIRQSKSLPEFTATTEADLYLWALGHQRYLAQIDRQSLQEPEEAAREF